MSSSSPLKAFRKTVIKEERIEFFKNDETTDSINDATEVQFGTDKNKYSLDMATNFYNDEKLTDAQSLRSVVFCYLHEKDSITDYKVAGESLNIPVFSFLVKTELSTWLHGNSDTCMFIKKEAEDKTSKSVKSTDSSLQVNNKKHKLDDPQLERISKFERESVDHNAALRGSKNIDFGYLVSDAKKFIHELKRTKHMPRTNSQGNSGPKKQPIILVSPATTALLSLSNIKEFLEDGVFTEPVPGNRPNGGLVIVNHPSDKLISTGQKIMVVDNIENFNKMEYWDRVIAIFTTGQTWQFSRYIHPEPEVLFQKYRGFYFGYQGEIAPPQIKDWNVTEVRVDRDKRFKDKVIVRDFWVEIEKILVNKGYGKLY